jgi:hypothetical protein
MPSNDDWLPEPQPLQQLAAGRTVRTWASDRPGEDLNDALQRAMREKGAA